MDQDATAVDDIDQGHPQIDPSIRCARCEHTLAQANDVLPSTDDAPVYANPHGMVFEIVLVCEAEGAAPVTTPDPEFSWFRDTAWQVAVCRRCRQHVGWKYLSTTGRAPFWGLIRDRVREA